jgi:hypothetical protein
VQKLLNDKYQKVFLSEFDSGCVQTSKKKSQERKYRFFWWEEDEEKPRITPFDPAYNSIEQVKGGH